jgi:hypothetical protein
MRLGAGDGLRMDMAALQLFDLCCGSESGERMDWFEKDTTEGFREDEA